MNNFEESPLVGPRSEDREDSSLNEGVAANGEPLWMAFLDNPEALTISPDEVHDAKNAYEKMKNEHPEVISICAHKNIEECKTAIRKLGSERRAA